MWRDIAFLINTTESVDEYGNITAVETQKEIYCNVCSISQKEFYQAQSVGFQPEIKIEMMSIDYNSEKFVEYSSKRYRVLRTYIRQDEVIEIVLTSLNERNENNANS